MGSARRCTRTAAPAVSSHHHHAPPRPPDIRPPSTKTDTFPDARNMPGVVQDVENAVNIALTQRPPPRRQPRQRTTQRGSSAAPPTTSPTRARYSERGMSDWRSALCVIPSSTQDRHFSHPAHRTPSKSISTPTVDLQDTYYTAHMVSTYGRVRQQFRVCTTLPYAPS